MTLEELYAAKARVESAMLRGESVIEFEGRRTEFRSYEDMLSQLDWINGQIEIESGGEASRFARVRVTSSRKDLEY